MNREIGKVYKNLRRIISVVLVLLLSLSPFTIGATENSYCDERDCKSQESRSVQIIFQAGVDFSFHSCCTGSTSDECDLNKDVNSDEPILAFSSLRVDNRNLSTFLIVSMDGISEDQTLKGLGAQRNNKSQVHCASIFIKNVALLI